MMPSVKIRTIGGMGSRHLQNLSYSLGGFKVTINRSR